VERTTRWSLILGWTAAASVCTFVIWIPLGALAGSLGSPSGIASAPMAMLLYVLYSPLLAPIVAGVVAPGYAVVFWVWERSCRRYPALDDGWRSIATAAAIISVPPAVAVSAFCAQGPLGVQYADLLRWLPFCLATLWTAIVSPRWLLDSLQPRAFSHPQYAMREA
jgi:hypothetical protein